MNEKTARQIAEMKTQTIGVEVEMNNITRQKAAKVAATYFGTGRYENTASRNGYSTWSAWDSQGREWKFQKDVSIAGPEEQECELVTPILTYGASKPCRSFAGSSDMPERKATPAVAVEFTSTSERRGTRRRAFGTLPILWRAMKA